MKSLFTIILIGIFSFLVTAQEAPPCPPTGVTTNPENPSNTIEPSGLHQMHQNDFFDWTALEYETQLGQFFPTGIMINPNHDPNGATRHLGLEPDYLPEDGWDGKKTLSQIIGTG